MYTDKIRKTIEELTAKKQTADNHQVTVIEAEITELYKRLINFQNMR